MIVIDGDAILNPEGLRMEREFVRHKLLDAIGDLYVLGAPLIARFEARYSGHALNNLLARELLARPQAWRMVGGQLDAGHPQASVHAGWSEGSGTWADRRPPMRIGSTRVASPVRASVST